MKHSLLIAFVCQLVLGCRASQPGEGGSGNTNGRDGGTSSVELSPRGGAPSAGAGRAGEGGGSQGGHGGMSGTGDAAVESGGRSGMVDAGPHDAAVDSGGSSGPAAPAPANAAMTAAVMGCGALCEGGTCVDPATCNVAVCSGAIGLPARPSLSVGSSPRAVLAADLNGDGRQDLVSVNTVDKSISVLLNNGRGTFAPERHYPLGDVLNPDTLIAADLTGDAKPELISADGLVFTNQGDGSFAAPVHAFDHNATALVAADLDSDGRSDLVLAGYNTNQVTVLLNQGGGQYMPADYPPGEAPLRIVSADFNRDDRPDVATLSADAKRVQVLLNEGAGKLSQPHIYQTGLTYTATTNGVLGQLVAADLDADGAVDLIAADALELKLSLLKNRNDGTFAAPSVRDVALTPRALTAADLNADGKPDLLMVDSGRDTLGILFNQGAWSFAPAQLIAAGFQPWALAVADLNGDQELDLAAANETTNDLDVFWSRGDGSFVAPIALRLAQDSWPAQLSTADLDGDQRPDIVTLSGAAIAAFYSSRGLSRVADLSLMGTSVSGFVVADVDGDTRVDLTVTDVRSLQVLRSQGAGQFRLSGMYLADPTQHIPRRIVAADVNRDGHLDIVSSDRDRNNVGVWLNTGKLGDRDLLFMKPVTYPAGMLPEALVAVDFNHDGALDLAVVNSRPQSAPQDQSCTISVLLNDGHGIFAAPQPVTVGHNPTALISADLDEDTHPDLLVADSDDEEVQVLRGQGNGAFGPAVRHAVPTTPSQLAALDLNADKHLDLVVGGVTGSLRVLLSSGAGQLGAPVRYSAGRSVGPFGAGDFNRDGRIDLVTASPAAGRILLMLNQCLGD